MVILDFIFYESDSVFLSFFFGLVFRLISENGGLISFNILFFLLNGLWVGVYVYYKISIGFKN